jgi:transposase-like protein
MLRLERQRDNAILAAIENGASVRAVSRAIGVNHETTRQIVRELRAAS